MCEPYFMMTNIDDKEFNEQDMNRIFSKIMLSSHDALLFAFFEIKFNLRFILLLVNKKNNNEKKEDEEAAAQVSM